MAISSEVKILKLLALETQLLPDLCCDEVDYSERIHALQQRQNGAIAAAFPLYRVGSISLIDMGVSRLSYIYARLASCD